MKVTGHSTREMFDRYNTVDNADTNQGVDLMVSFLENVHQSVHHAELADEDPNSKTAEKCSS